MNYRHFQLVWWPWMLQDWHLYRWRERASARHPKEIRWHDWVRVL